MSQGRARHTLTVELSIKNGALRRVLRPSYGEERRSDEPLEDVGRDYVVDGRRGLEALRYVLEKGDQETLHNHLSGPQLTHAGHALFRALVGPEEGAWSLVKKALFHQDSAAPTNQPVRVRVLPEAEELAGLPWGLTTWRGCYLRDFGWTFEVGHGPVPSDDIRLKLPTGILLIVPDLPEDDIDSRGHREALVEQVEGHFHGFSQGSLFAVAATKRDVDRALRQVRPSIIYYYGHGIGGAAPGLWIPDDHDHAAALWTAQDVALAIANSQAPVQIAYLNGCSTGGGGWQSVGRQLLARVPVVLAQPTTTWSRGARSVALGWLGRVLSGREPIAAAFHRETHQPMGGLGWLPPLVFSRHNSFTVEYSKTSFGRERSGFDLDRHWQREQAHSQVRQLVVRPERKVQGFVALGSPNNHPEAVPKQLRDYIEELDPRCELHMTPPLPVGLSLMRKRSAEPSFADDFEHRLAVALGFDWGASLKEALEARAPTRTARNHRVLWLDWQVLEELPVLDDVEAWMSFCAGRLARAVPSGVDVIVTIAIEAPAPKVAPLQEALEELVNEPTYRTDEARFTVLPVLSAPSRGEVLQFLDDAGCPGHLREAIANTLLAQPRTDYEELARRMDEGLALTWQGLLGRLGGPTSNRRRADDL